MQWKLLTGWAFCLCASLVFCRCLEQRLSAAVCVDWRRGAWQSSGRPPRGALPAGACKGSLALTPARGGCGCFAGQCGCLEERCLHVASSTCTPWWHGGGGVVLLTTSRSEFNCRTFLHAFSKGCALACLRLREGRERERTNKSCPWGNSFVELLTAVHWQRERLTLCGFLLPNWPFWFSAASVLPCSAVVLLSLNPLLIASCSNSLRVA